MGKRKRKSSMPILLCWSKRDQLRFIEAVERFQSLVNDLEVILASPKRRSEAARKANETRKAAAAVVNGLGGAQADTGREGS